VLAVQEGAPLLDDTVCFIVPDMFNAIATIRMVVLSLPMYFCRALLEQLSMGV
jgi:hypothetical protein